jgi:murein DD-endopeptidase MepM/ murein hydrolase activator NlpD
LKHDDALFLRVASGLSYYKVQCPNQEERTYTVFRAYQRHFNETAMFYLGISEQETAIFSDVKTYGKVESMSFLAEVGNEARISVDENSLRRAVEAEQVIEDEIEKENQALEEANSELDDLIADMESKSNGDKNNTTEDTVESTPEPGVEESQGESKEETKEEFISTDYVVCIGSRHLNVRDQNLEDVLFKAKLGESVKLFQSWSGDDTVEKIINGVKYEFKRVLFSERESEDQNKGFVAGAFIKKRSDCRYLNKGQSVRENPADEITGLDDPRCCDFPTADKPTHSYTSGMRRFGGGRSGGKRRHAACDLYRYKDEPIRSVAPGKVIRNLYSFYQGTYALEVVHSGGFVVRYGEMTGKVFVRGGRKVKMGQRIGNMGKVNSGCCRPMLHFELYSGSKKGALSTGKGPYRRRSDLLDPTQYLLKWQDKVF